jgi:hypothetical protein
MKKQLFISILLFLFVFQNNIWCDTLANTDFLKKNVVDTIHFLPAIGSIKCNVKSKIVNNDSLNHVFLAKLQATIQSTTNKHTITYINNDTAISLAATEYLVNVIPRFEKIPEDAFSEIGIGKDLDNLLKKQKGRYFGIVFYQGSVSSTIYHEALVGAIVGGMVAAAFTGNLFIAYPIIINGANLITKIVIIDKQTKHFIFYTDDERQRSPTEEQTIFKAFSSIFKELDSNSKH